MSTLGLYLPETVAVRSGATITAATERQIRTLIIGSGPRGAKLAASLANDERRRVIGVMDTRRLPEAEQTLPGLEWLGTVDALRSVVLQRAVDEICVALPLQSCFAQWLEAQAIGRELGVPVSLDLQLLEHPDRTQLAAVPNGPLLRCNVHPSTRRVALAKRLFDLVGATTALLLLSPLLLVAAILVKITSRGPILFRQPRVGRNRRSFDMLKFRTMVEDAESLRSEVETLNDATGIMFKIARDPRLTRIGPLLRRTSIDELPQLFNVLRGEMSLVGPRPIPLWVFEQIDEPSFHRRFAVLPGMTGLWQVHGRPQQYRLMALHDLEYVDHWTLWMDLKILARTPAAVMRRQGAL